MAEKDHSYTRLKIREVRMRSAKLGCEVRSYDAKCEARMQSAKPGCKVRS